MSPNEPYCTQARILHTCSCLHHNWCFAHMLICFTYSLFFFCNTVSVAHGNKHDSDSDSDSDSWRHSRVPVTLTYFRFASVDFREDGGDRGSGQLQPKCKERLYVKGLGVTSQDTCQPCLPRTEDPCVAVLEPEAWCLVQRAVTDTQLRLQPRCVLMLTVAFWQAVLVELQTRTAHTTPLSLSALLLTYWRPARLPLITARTVAPLELYLLLNSLLKILSSSAVSQHTASHVPSRAQKRLGNDLRVILLSKTSPTSDSLHLIPMLSCVTDAFRLHLHPGALLWLKHVSKISPILLILCPLFALIFRSEGWELPLLGHPVRRVYSHMYK